MDLFYRKPIAVKPTHEYQFTTDEFHGDCIELISGQFKGVQYLYRWAYFTDELDTPTLHFGYRIVVGEVHLIDDINFRNVAGDILCVLLEQKDPHASFGIDSSASSHLP